MTRKLMLLIPLCASLLFAAFAIPSLASAASVEGTVQGFHCVTMGKVCPLGKEDPIAAIERVFVVLTADGSYYFVPNLDRALLARHLAEKVRVIGTLNAKYNSIQAKSLEVWTGGQWKTVWSAKMQEELDKQLLMGT